mmetsp:Transcript_109244/g.319802  ORF Transcript_109244/g.319802 Transcript_109244/m.319802 type:complete len:86 (-) Transcript_109244:31-288(-)
MWPTADGTHHHGSIVAHALHAIGMECVSTGHLLCKSLAKGIQTDRTASAAAIPKWIEIHWTETEGGTGCHSVKGHLPPSLLADIA